MLAAGFVGEVRALRAGLTVGRRCLACAGSASAGGAIRLNRRLIHLPPEVIDYVVVHELAHLHEMNHSARFWQHVARALPDFEARRERLKSVVTPEWDG